MFILYIIRILNLINTSILMDFDQERRYPYVILSSLIPIHTLNHPMYKVRTQVYIIPFLIQEEW